MHLKKILRILKRIIKMLEKKLIKDNEKVISRFLINYKNKVDKKLILQK